MGISSSDLEYLGTPKKLGRSAAGEAGWMPTPLLRRQRKPLLSRRTKILIAAVGAALPAGYFVFGGDILLIDVAVPPDPADDAPFQLLPNVIVAAEPRDGGATGTPRTRGSTTATLAPWNRDDRPPDNNSPPGGGPLDLTPAPRSVIAAPLPPEVRTAGNTSEPAASRGYDPQCLPTSLSVRQSFPAARPSWTLRAPGHEGTKCWFAAGSRPAGPLHAAAPGHATEPDAADDAARAVSPERRRSGPPVAIGYYYDPACLPSAAAVRQYFPEARPSWTMWMPGHEGAQCWYPSRPRTATPYARMAPNPLSLRAETEQADGDDGMSGMAPGPFSPFVQW